MYPLQLTIDPCYTITPNKFHISKNAHILMADVHPLQLIIDPWYTITPNKLHILMNAHIPMADVPPSIDHRSMLHHYTQ